MEIKRKEILVSIAISLFFVTIGFPVSNKILESKLDRAEIYQKALKVKEESTFQYALETRQGNLISEATFIAVDPVKFPEMTKTFIYVEKVKQEYVMKIRYIAEVTDSKGNVVSPARTETYWEWDNVGRLELMSNELSFFGTKYKTNLFSLISDHRVDASEVVKATNGGWLDNGKYYYETKSIRYYYNVIPKEFQASFIAVASDKGLVPANSEKSIRLQNYRMTELIEKQIRNVESGNIFFWIIWVLLIAAVIYGYLSLENRYLD